MIYSVSTINQTDILMADEKFTYSKRYNDEDLRAMAICIMRHVRSGGNIGLEFILMVAQRAGMHPQLVVQNLERLEQIKL